MQLISSLQTIIFEYVFPRNVEKILNEILTYGEGDMHMLLLIMERLKTTRKEFMLHSWDVFDCVSTHCRLDVMVCLCMQFKPTLEEFMCVNYIPFRWHLIRDNGNLDIMKYIATRFELAKELTKREVFTNILGTLCVPECVKNYEWVRQHFNLNFTESNIVEMFKSYIGSPVYREMFVSFKKVRPAIYLVKRLCENGKMDAATWIYKVLRWKKGRLAEVLYVMKTDKTWSKFYEWYHALPDS